MRLAAAWSKLSRSIAFARHMPVAKLARRVELDVRRRMRDRFPAASSDLGATMARAESGPLALLPPRRALAPVLDDGRPAFTFLNRQVAMAGPGVDWQRRRQPPPISCGA